LKAQDGIRGTWVTVMKGIIARCGYRCNLCLAYNVNIRSVEDQKRVSDGWFRIYGFRIPPEDIQCDGCLTPDSENPRLIDIKCPVRPCVIEKKLENCAYCDEYICNKIEQRLVTYDSVQDHHKEPISKENYENFIKPYENKKTFDELRETLRKAQRCAK